VKRSLLSEARGVPVSIVIAGANRHDLPLLEYTLESIPPRLEVRRQRLLRRAQAKGLTQSQNLCLDKGFESAKAVRIAHEFGLCPHIRSRGEEAVEKQEGKRARRWVVECGHSWLNRYRALLIRWNKNTANYIAFVHLACANLTLKRLTG
jgi:transposase